MWIKWKNEQCMAWDTEQAAFSCIKEKMWRFLYVADIQQTHALKQFCEELYM